MSDIKMMQDQIDGLIAKGQGLRKNEAVFLKIQGINETIETTNQERATIKKDLVKAKKDKQDLIKKKNDAVADSAKKIVEKLNAILPVGNAVFDCVDGLVIGWEDEDGKTTPYNGLSGCQKQIFDTALAHVLDADIIVLEAAELDSDHMAAALEDLAKVEKQVIINTCHPVGNVPSPFVKIELEEVAA